MIQKRWRWRGGTWEMKFECCEMLLFPGTLILFFTTAIWRYNSHTYNLPFKIYSSVIFSIFILLFNPPHNLEHF